MTLSEVPWETIQETIAIVLLVISLAAMKCTRWVSISIALFYFFKIHRISTVHQTTIIIIGILAVFIFAPSETPKETKTETVESKKE